MAGENVEVAVMFADVSGSTRLYETLGDANASRIIGKVIDVMRTATELYQGFVIKTIGDEVMSRFFSADDCLRAAQEIQEEISSGISGETISVMIKVGIHYGPAILEEDGDVFGDAVNVAARMASIAKGTQIILTRETVRHLRPDLQDKCRPFDKAFVRGKEEAIDVHQLVWETSGDVTQIQITEAEQSVRYLNLEYQGEQTRIASNDHRLFVIGRGVQCDLLCSARLASRRHASIEFKQGGFQLTDESSNGTFILTDTGQSIRIRRQDFTLYGAGTIALGEEVPREDPAAVIRYVVDG